MLRRSAWILFLSIAACSCRPEDSVDKRPLQSQSLKPPAGVQSVESSGVKLLRFSEKRRGRATIHHVVAEGPDKGKWHGPYIEHYPGGQRYAAGQYRLDKRDGVFTFYRPTGEIQHQTRWVAGKHEGVKFGPPWWSVEEE